MIKVEAKNGRITGELDGNVIELTADALTICCSLVHHIEEADNGAGTVLRSILRRELVTKELTNEVYTTDGASTSIDLSFLHDILDKMKGGDSDNVHGDD